MSRLSIIAVILLLLLGGAGLVVHDRTRNREGSVEVPIEKVAPDPKKPDEFHRNSVVPGLVEILSDLSIHYTRHIEAVRGLPKDLSLAELDELMALIKGPVPENRTTSGWHVIVNEIMNVLHEPRCDQDAYRLEMAQIVLDREMNPVLRDYAAQHLTLSIKSEGPYEERAELDHVVATCLEVVTAQEDSYEDVTGTILLSLCSLRERLPSGAFADFDERLVTAIEPMVTGERQVSMSNRISAIQVAGRMEDRSILPAIREIAQQDHAKFPVRLSAIASLGYFAQAEDRRLLERIANNHPKLEPAALQALAGLAPE